MTTTTLAALQDVEESLRMSCRTAILEGDLDEAQILLTMLKQFKVDFRDIGALTQEEVALILSGSKIEAIVRVRARTHMPLKEAKEFVEAEMDRRGIARSY